MATKPVKTKTADTPRPTPETTENFEPRKLYSVDIDLLHPDPNQPRKAIDETELKELAASIKNHGILQPILFQKVDDKLVVVAGERRYQATKLLKLKEIPAIFVNDNTSEIALIENLMRVDLTAFEEAQALQQLKDASKYKNKDLADVIGKSEATISELLSLNKIPQELREKHLSNRLLARRELFKVARIKDEEAMKNAFKKLVKSVEKAENNSGNLKKPQPRKPELVWHSLITTLTDKIGSPEIHALPKHEQLKIVEALQLLIATINESKVLKIT